MRFVEGLHVQSGQRRNVRFACCPKMKCHLR
jgi:hypothetical protein